MELPYDSAIPLLDIYPKKRKKQFKKIYVSPCSLTAAFIKAKIQKQPKHSLTDEWIKMSGTHTHTHTHTQEYYSAIRNNVILPFATTWMGLKYILLSEISQRKNKYCSISLYV